MSIGNTCKCAICKKVSWYVLDDWDWKNRADQYPIIICHNCVLKLTMEIVESLQKIALKENKEVEEDE